WKKDGKPLPQERDFHFSKNLRILNIPEGQKSDCGSYSCNVSNEISWQESSLNLTIAGGELWRWLSAYTHGLVCVSSILVHAAALLWM
ncbi:hypothetical protein G0U57_011505, partial [Chelydra serpentina]